MLKLVRLLLKIVRFFGLSLISVLFVTAVIAIRHLLDTPQQLQSVLAGEERIYRWRLGHIFYKVLGNEDAPPLVLLHSPGISRSSHEMRKIIEPLARDYHVYALDLLGFGLSDRPDIGYAAETYTTLCHDFLAEVVGQPATLLASGVSCNYAVAVAASSPKLCERLVLISPVVLFTEGVQAISLTQEMPLQLKEVGKTLASTRLLESPLLQALLFPLYALLQERFHIGTDAHYSYATTHQFGAQYAPIALLAGKLIQDVTRQFETLQQPILIIWGANALNNARYLTNQHDISPQTHMELIQDAGIFVHEEHPLKVVANIRNWNEDSRATQPVSASKKSVTSIPDKNQSLSTSETPTAPISHQDEPLSASETPPAPVSLQDEPDATEETPETPGSISEDKGEVIEAYCVKCKKKTEVKNPYEVTLKNGSPAIRGTCSVCGTKIYRMGRLNHEAELEGNT